MQGFNRAVSALEIPGSVLPGTLQPDSKTHNTGN